MAINNLTPSLFANYDPYGGGFSVNENARPYGNTSLMTPSFPERKEYNLIPEELVPYKGDMIENITTTGSAVNASNAGNAGKNKQLALMLYALGGALKGDKNFVQNTMKLQQMQEGKKKQEEKKKNYQEFIKTIPEESPFYDLAKTMGPENLDKLLIERYKAEQPKQVDASKAIKQEELNVLNKLKSLDGDVEKLNNYEKLIYKNFIEKEDSQSILQELGLISNNISSKPLEIEEIKKG